MKKINWLRHKAIRFMEQPSGVLDLFLKISPTYSQYFLTVKKFTDTLGTYIDIGANKGNVIKACIKNFPGTKIYAIEPIIEHCESMAKLYPNIKIFSCGLWDENTEKDFWFVKNRDVESSFLKPLEVREEELEKRTVTLRRFDSLPIVMDRPCFVKIDVEESEDRVLKGFGDKLEEVDFIQLEQTHSYRHENRGKIGENISLLEKYGFTGFIQLNTTYYSNGFPMKSDLLFFRDNKKIRANII
jgi:FkbM family methyltransferase